VNPGTVLLLGLLVLVYLNFVGRRRARRDREAVLQRLVPGAEVVTTSGLHATVTELPDDGTVLLQTAPGIVTRWERPAVGRVVTSPADAAVEATDATEPEAAVEEPEVDSPRALGGTAADGSPAHPPVEPVREGLPDTAPPDRV
jgi:preprotein translocase subunit YajC